MAGSYCRFCDLRCFVLRVIPDGPSRGRTIHLATCQGGMAHDLKVTGHTHITAVNPVTEPEAAAVIAAEMRALGQGITGVAADTENEYGCCRCQVYHGESDGPIYSEHLMLQSKHGIRRRPKESRGTDERA